MCDMFVTGSASEDVDAGDDQIMSERDVQGVSAVGLFSDLSSVRVKSEMLECAKVC
jgi:hypothetical protein